MSTTAANPAINKKIPYDPINDFMPVINIAATPNVIAAPQLSGQGLRLLRRVLKKQNRQVLYASSGTGGIGHLQTELWKSPAGVFVTHIRTAALARH